MKLVNSLYGLEIQLEENYVTILVIENASTLSRLVNDLNFSSALIGLLLGNSDTRVHSSKKLSKNLYFILYM